VVAEATLVLQGSPWAHEVALAALELIPKLSRSGSAKREPQRSSSPAFSPRLVEYLLEVEEDSIV
jgi:hypothetical protein